MPNEPDVVESPDAEWEDIAPEDLTFDDLWSGGTAPQAEEEEPPEEEEPDSAPAPASPTIVKVGRDELEVGDGPGQWTEDQVKLIQQYKKEADSQKSSAQSLEATLDKLAKQNAQIQQRFDQMESEAVSRNAPESAQEPSSAILERAAAVDADLGADGAVKALFGDLYKEIESLRSKASQFEGMSSTTQEIDYERRMEREASGLYRDLADVGIDPNDTDVEFSDVPEGTTPYAFGHAWMTAYQRSLRENGVKDDQVFSPAWMAAARFFAAWKVSSEVQRSLRGKTNDAGPQATAPRAPLVPSMRPRTTTSAAHQARPSYAAPDSLTAEDQALIPR